MTGVVPNAVDQMVAIGDPLTPANYLKPNSDGSMPATLSAGTAVIGKVNPDGGSPASSSITNATGSSQTLLAANANRKSVLIINPIASTTNWTIDITGAAVVAATVPGFVLSPGDVYSPVNVPKTAITGIGTAASTLVVLEG